jgi:hypothetical protein
MGFPQTLKPGVVVRVEIRGMGIRKWTTSAEVIKGKIKNPHFRNAGIIPVQSSPRFRTAAMYPAFRVKIYPGVKGISEVPRNIMLAIVRVDYIKKLQDGQYNNEILCKP